MFNPLSEFDIQVSTGTGQVMGREVARLILTVTEKASGMSESMKLSMNLDRLPEKVDSIIVRKFAHTKRAERIRQERGMYPVKLLDEAMEYPFTALHTALRKSCDSSGSSLWWSFLQDCHPIVINHLMASTEAQLNEIVGKEYTLAQVADRLKTGWANFLSEGVSTARQIKKLDSHWIDEFSAIPFDEVKDLSHTERNKLQKDLKFAAMMFDYLSKKDWLGMAAGMVEM